MGRGPKFSKSELRYRSTIEADITVYQNSAGALRHYG